MANSHPSGHRTNQSNRIQTYRQSVVSQVRATVHRLVNSIHQNKKPHSYKRCFFTKRFSLCCTLVDSIGPPLRITTVLFSSDGGGSVFFKPEITKFNMTSLLSVCTSVVFLWLLCKSVLCGATEHREGTGIVGDEGKGQTTQGPSFPYTLLKKIHTPCPTQVLSVCYM